jgi:hypothetical protein
MLGHQGDAGAEENAVGYRRCGGQGGKRIEAAPVVLDVDTVDQRRWTGAGQGRWVCSGRYSEWYPRSSAATAKAAGAMAWSVWKAVTPMCMVEIPPAPWAAN